MAITNGYCELDELKSEMRLKVNDLEDDGRLEIAIAAASRQIDAHCGRRFWQDSTVKVREYMVDDEDCALVDDISTTTGLIVKIDTDQDGSYETTLTIDTDFKLAPFNAADEVPVWPYYELRLMPNSSYYFPVDDDVPTLQITARFGWPAVPDDVKKACLIQSAMLFKSADAVFGVTEFAGSGVAMRVRSQLNPIAEALLEPYCKPRVG
jgi:hypothetical protein